MQPRSTRPPFPLPREQYLRTPNKLAWGFQYTQVLIKRRPLRVFGSCGRPGSNRGHANVRLADRYDCSTSWMISAFSDAEYVMRRPPHPCSYFFFEQTVLQGQIGHDLLQGSRLTMKILHLIRGSSSGGVPGQPTFTGL
jgi:hypothetical protein